MSKKLASIKKTVVANRTRILVTTTVIATTAVVIQARAIRLHNDFLEEKGLMNEYYNMDED